MTRTIDPRYQFSFFRADESSYTRQVYFEALYAFDLREGLILAAARPVPQSGMHYALYQLLQDTSARSVIGHMLPEAAGTPGLPDHSEGSTDLVAKVEEVLPDTVTALPDDILQEYERRAETIVSESLATYGIESGLTQFDGSFDFASVPIRGPQPTGPLNFAAGTNDEDAAWVNLSFDVDQALKRWIRDSLNAESAQNALARYGDFEDDLYRKLYTNRKYLNFIRQVMNARGSYISPVVRDFLAFYAKSLNRKLNQHAEKENVDPDIVRMKLEGLFGTVKGRSHHFLNYHDLTILGRVPAGSLPKDEADPDMTETSYKVDPELAPDSLEIREIEGRLQRFIVRKTIHHTFNIHHNIQRVHYLDEGDPSGKL
jgi:hypothetical protein